MHRHEPSEAPEDSDVTHKKCVLCGQKFTLDAWEWIRASNVMMDELRKLRGERVTLMKGVRDIQRASMQGASGVVMMLRAVNDLLLGFVDNDESSGS